MPEIIILAWKMEFEGNECIDISSNPFTMELLQICINVDWLLIERKKHQSSFSFRFEILDTSSLSQKCINGECLNGC